MFRFQKFVNIINIVAVKTFNFISRIAHCCFIIKKSKLAKLTLKTLHNKPSFTSRHSFQAFKTHTDLPITFGRISEEEKVRKSCYFLNNKKPSLLQTYK